MLSPNYYSGWNHAVSQMSADMESRKAFVIGLADYGQVAEYKSWGNDYYKGIAEAVATYQKNRKVPLKADVKLTDLFKQTV